MAWIRVFTDFDDNPKTLKLKELLNNPYADALPQRLWRWALKHAPGGDLSRFSARIIVSGCCWETKGKHPDQVIAALKSAGFLDEDMTIHDWAEGSGQYETKTINGRARAKRFYDKHKKNQQVDAGRIEEHMPIASREPNAGSNGDLTRRKRLDNADLRPLDPDPDPDPDPDKKIKTPPYPPRGVRPETDGLTEALEIARPAPRHPDDDDFEKFITAYPAHRRNRMRAEQAWFTMNGKKPALDVILKCLEADKGCDEWGRSSGRHIPGADKWITDRRWEREPEKEPY